MSRMICVMGESGSGKTTAMRTLDPSTTMYIDCDRKGLSWKGWRSQYSTEKKNYICERDLQKVNAYLLGVGKQRKDIKTIVIDTLNTCMVDKEIKGLSDKSDGYGKWVDLAQFVWQVCETGASLRDDLTVIIVMHSETIRDDLGYSFTRIKTNGRKLEKVVLESLFSTVLLAKAKEDGSHVFETQARLSTAKTPLGAFDQFEVPNDMGAVLTVLADF